MTSRRRQDPPEEPDKPIEDMTPAERAAYAARLRQTRRERQVRRGTRPPRSARDFGIWREAQAEADERGAARIARAERWHQQQEAGEGNSDG